MPGRAPIVGLRSACVRRSARSTRSPIPRPTSTPGSAWSTWRCRECPTSAARSKCAAASTIVQQQRPDLGSDHGAGGVFERGVAAQQPIRRPLSVFRPRHRYGGDRSGRRHAQWHGNAGRAHAADQRTSAGGSGYRSDGTSHRDIATGDDDRHQSCRGWVVIRIEARRHQFVADRGNGDPANRFASGSDR